MTKFTDTISFLAGLHTDDGLMFNDYTIRLTYSTEGEVAQDINIAMERVGFFIFDLLQRSIFIPEADVAARENYIGANIPTIDIPAAVVVDRVVQAVIVTKINAILEGVAEVVYSEMSSRLGGNVTYIWDITDYEDNIHDFVNADDQTKWWAMPEARFDSIFNEEEDVEWPLTWKSLQLEWYDPDATEEYEVDSDADVNNDKVIVMQDFLKPKS